MSTMNNLHRKAMDFAALALTERARGNPDKALALSEQALESELDAIRELENLDRLVEPTYSVLHRSAGTLALDCNQYRLAEKLASKALAQEPPLQIAEELRDLLEQIYFQRHLALKGVDLAPDEVQMSLSGRGVGLGIARTNDLLGRIGDSSRLIQRIVERQSNLPFRDRGRPTKAIEDNHQSFMSVPRAASFAVTLKFGHSAHQLPFPGISPITEVVDEFMELMYLVNSLEISIVEKRIPDPAYLRNFLALARKIAPDGEQVRQVGFTVSRDGSERSVELLTPRSTIPSSPFDKSSSSTHELRSIRGTLRYADATHDNRNRIRIVDQEQTVHPIDVPEGMMNDIVRPMWDLEVELVAERIRRGRGYTELLRDIQPLERDLTDEESTSLRPWGMADDRPGLLL